MIKQEKLNMGGINRRYFVEYFECQGGVTLDGENFIGDGWKVRISPETFRDNEILKLPRVEITLLGEEALLVRFIENLRKNFLRGGG
ncbi:MAG: hypothetical protein WBH44_06955 [Proteocatella sp.]